MKRDIELTPLVHDLGQEPNLQSQEKRKCLIASEQREDENPDDQIIRLEGDHEGIAQTVIVHNQRWQCTMTLPITIARNSNKQLYMFRSLTMQGGKPRGYSQITWKKVYHVRFTVADCVAPFAMKTASHV